MEAWKGKRTNIILWENLLKKKKLMIDDEIDKRLASGSWILTMKDYK